MLVYSIMMGLVSLLVPAAVMHNVTKKAAQYKMYFPISVNAKMM